MVLVYLHKSYGGEMFRYVRRLAKRIRRNDTTRQIEERFAGEWTEESIPKLVDASNAQRLEEKERNQRPRTTRLPEQHEGVGRKYQEIPDPWN